MNDIQKLMLFTKNLKILVVEDNQNSREQFIEMLSNICDNVSGAFDGMDGLQYFKSQQFDLIITDINMPRMNGIEMIEEIRKVDEDISIIIVSAHNETSYLDRTKNFNIEDFLFKPIGLEHFLGVMSNLKNKKR
jgi:YesN/AraC family two-component response regulator